MLPGMVRTLYDYNQWAHERVWACIQTLDDAQFTRPFDYSLGSVRDQIVHVMSVDARWFARLAGESLMPHLQAVDYGTVDAARVQWQVSALRNREIMGRLSDAQLGEEITYDMPHRGGLKRTARWQVVAHVVNHGTDHRAQMLGLLHQLGAPTVEQDLMFYLWDQADQTS
jgi:uncharacterized damage-inducible protein DinB